jgi:hypothetical protein
MPVLRWLTISLVFAAAPLAAAQALSTDPRDPGAVFRSLDAGQSPATRPSKAWLTDFAAFTSAHPGVWIVGRSQEPCLSEQEAQQAARADAAQAVYALLPQRLRDADDTDALKRSVLSAIAAGGLVTDAFPERFDRPYGTVWTESVLLDASPQKLDSFLAGYDSAWRDRQRRLSIMRASAAGLVTAAWLMYIFLNAVTKGYFTTHLRLGAAAVTAAALILFL